MSESLAGHLAYVQDAVRQVRPGQTLRASGGGSKPALSSGATLELKDVSGVTAYNPQEYTFTALAATPLAEVEALLAAEGQFLPFDPPLAAAGGTLGGTVAAGLSGPGRYRYGGVRDFLLGVTFVDGLGEVVSGGGKVVKNAAGFDFPKLLVGSLGRFGIMVDLTFKVFPHPETYATLQLDAPDFSGAERLLRQLARSSFEPYALELLPQARVLARFGGLNEALAARLERVQTYLGLAGEVLTGEREAELWQRAKAFDWVPEGHGLVKVALGPQGLAACEAALQPYDLPHRYSVGGNVSYLAWPEALGPAELDKLLRGLRLAGLALTGRWAGHNPQLGVRTGGAFLERVSSVFDPHGIFSQAIADKEVTGAA